MALTTVTLKPNTFITLEDAREFLKIKANVVDAVLDNQINRLINMVTDMAEKYIDGPIKNRTIVETRDGDSSDTMVPDYFPVQSVTSIKIDYNRQFDSSSVIDASDYILRGLPSLDQVLSVGIRGTDVVIRDDGNTSILGQIFTGSVVGAIQLTYVAGWGDTQEKIPYDLQHAVLLGIEYFYVLRENREMNVKSKTNGAGTSQAYSRELGLPKEVTDILETYKDYSLGRNNKPQRNTFSV